MSASVSTAGRKRESDVWRYFEFDVAKNAIKCTAVNSKTNVLCAQWINGKNPTNMKKHVQACHADVFVKLQETETARKKLTAKRVADKLSTSSSHGNIKDCFNRKIPVWSQLSTEHQRRTKALLDMVVSTGSPVSMMDNSAFRDFCRTLDPKFKPPGMFLVCQCSCNNKATPTLAECGRPHNVHAAVKQLPSEAPSPHCQYSIY